MTQETRKVLYRVRKRKLHRDIETQRKPETHRNRDRDRETLREEKDHNKGIMGSLVVITLSFPISV